MENSILVKYGEIALRGKNRDKFERLLMGQVRNALGNGCVVKREPGRFIVESCNDDIEHAGSTITKIPGIHSVCFCAIIDDRDLATITDICVRYIEKNYTDRQYTFKIKTKRADKSYPMNSNEISAHIGEAALEKCPNLTVNVGKPDFTLNVEIRSRVYIYSREIQGFGGLPVSSSGRALCLLSGGIDSPVAAFLTAKRGVYTELVYFHSPPYVSGMTKQKVIDLAERLSKFIGETKLYVVCFTEVQEYLRDNVPEDKLTIFLKRSMLAIAELIADKNRMLALVVGDSVGQVASQTLYAINSIDSAVKTTVLRPLAGNNKQETVDLAKILGTFDISIQPYEDCCTIFVPLHPETKPKKSVIEAIERSLTELPILQRATLDHLETLTIGRIPHGGEVYA